MPSGQVDTLNAKVEEERTRNMAFCSKRSMVLKRFTLSTPARNAAGQSVIHFPYRLGCARTEGSASLEKTLDVLLCWGEVSLCIDTMYVKVRAI